MSGYFISGIGTGVGKTFVTCALTHQLRVAGKRVRALKPVISGFDETQPEASDTGQLLLAQGMEISPENIDAVSPWRFAAPLSPHLAARHSPNQKKIDLAATTGFCLTDVHSCSAVLIEGAGGLMVPLTQEFLVIDWMEALNIPTILVAATYLGAINHTLLSVEALLRRGIAIQAVVVSESAEAGASLQDTAASIAAFVPESVPVHTLARGPGSDCGWKSAPDLLSVLA